MATSESQLFWWSLSFYYILADRPALRSLRVLGVCQLVGHRLVMPLLPRPQLVMHWLVMHVLAKDSPGWPGDVSVTDLATMCACKFTLKITVD